MLVAVHAEGVAAVPLNVTVLEPCVLPKPVPAITTEVPKGPELGESVAMFGATVKTTPLLALPPTVTTTFPVVAPLGTGTVMLAVLHAVAVPGVPLKVTVLDPWVAPKFVPEIIIEVPIAPELGLSVEIVGFDPPPPPPPFVPPPELAQPVKLASRSKLVPKSERTCRTSAPLVTRF
jgi:hypothetical protein